MSSIIPKLDEITPESFLESVNRIFELKRKAGLVPYLDNPEDVRKRAELYATKYKNGSLGWASNIWSRSAANTVVINSESELKKEHKLLMLRVLEHILAQGPMIRVDGAYGSPNSKVRMHIRVYVDTQFPDLAYRWKQLVFDVDKESKVDATLFVVPHYLGNPNIPGSDKLLAVIRFPFQNFTIITLSSYQGEIKKGALCHWIFHAYKQGCTGEHAALREFSVRTVEESWKRVVLAIWGLTGSGKSTHGFYMWTEKNAPLYVKNFGTNPLDYVKDQEVKNDDIVAICEDRVYGSELGAWTKTEDLTPDMEAMWNGAFSSRALHENTEFDENGNPSFEGKLFQYFGSPNRNARTVLYLEDTGFFKGSVDSSGPLNTAVFLSPGYFTDYAWVKLNDIELAAKALADGRTVGHPAQARELVGKVRFVPRYTEFTIGIGDDAHVLRFYEFLKKWKERGNEVEIFMWNTTGRIIAKYRWVEKKLGDKMIMVPEPILQEVNGVLKPIGGERPTIEETEFFLLQATRGAVEYKPHPVWGEKVLVPKHVPGIKDERLKQLDPTTYLSMDEFKALLKAQIEESKYNLQKLGLKLPSEIMNAMDF
ncbi:phosphoenolpyruvate carboxykinase (ATP) [Fervidicoccus fontis]|uniref:Phosphoenolpyruvate carboxykinase-like protein n=1 Tax=Fervidicoccus fontis (strain DSM 19380 / JCM 18336 / VKM B-2539 / Kam940) TaxID=1163730 RepID=I0A0U6_FERFK|nr:phosphoenolpyruvate carboxykinase (ATP) [Fervidicoccus fontis]AFH42603.1 phosphoenolpyruvate carboxykinase-like protein [Fervidicoccus fontis Kam940]